MKICPKCDASHEKAGTYCSRTCANSRTWSEEDKKKKSVSVKKFLEDNGNWNVGKPGWKHTEEDKELKRQRTIEYHDRKGRVSEEEKRAKNVSSVQAYRQRKYSVTPDNVDRRLIRKIYENCPKGYEVDHIKALSRGGPHHQDNLQYLPALENRKKNDKDDYDQSLVIRWQDVLK